MQTDHGKSLSENAGVAYCSLVGSHGRHLVRPLAACPCLVGCWHVRRNIITGAPRLGHIAVVALAATMVIGPARNSFVV